MSESADLYLGKKKYSVLGQRPIRHDGADKVTGKAIYTADLALPNMDGWQTLASIRSNPTLAEIPVVAITAYHSFNVAEDARRAGFDAYFPKPLNISTFMNNLEQIITTRS